MRTAIALLVVLVGGCGPTPKPIGWYDQKSFPNICRNPTIIGVGDILEINVWDQKDLNTEATVRPDGTITMPLVGEIRAAGQTTTSLTNQIKTSLANYIKLSAGNEVTVAIKQWKSYRFTVQGEVGKPGQFVNDTCVTVSDAVALAGGPTRFAKRNSMILMRQDGKGETTSIPLDYDLIASGKRPDMNIWLMPGDVIYLP
jgi:polysaccharide export outer membrane protein